LPLVDTGKAWVSLPHFSYGGMLFNDEAQKQNESAITLRIIEEIKNKSYEAGFYKYESDIKKVQTTAEKYFIRTINNNTDNNYIKSEKVSSLLNLPSGEKELSVNINPNLRRKINKASKADIIIKNGGTELLDDFYKVYTRNIYKLKSLNYSKKFFNDLLGTYKFGEVKIFVAYKNDTAIGTGMLANYNGFYENMFFATLSNSRKEYISDLLHWEMICYSIKKNNSLDIADTNNSERTAFYSFGRSTHSSGVHKYKSHWPVTDHQLYTYSNLQDIRKKKWLSGIWGKLPFFISSPLGPHLINHIY